VIPAGASMVVQQRFPAWWRDASEEDAHCHDAACFAVAASEGRTGAEMVDALVAAARWC